MLTTADVNIHALIAKYGIDIQIVRSEMTKFKTDLTRTGIISNSYNEMFEALIVSFYVSTTTFFLLHCDKWDRVVALPRHPQIAKYGIGIQIVRPEMTKFKMFREKIFLFCGNYILKYW
jgi:hypothetical protein